MATRTADALRSVVSWTMLAWSCAGWGAEGFEPRYNLAGSLGGEMFAPPNQTGFISALAATYVSVSKVTGDDGGQLTQSIPGGTVALPKPTPSALYPSYSRGTVEIPASGTMTRWDLVLGYITSEQYGGGRLAFAVDVPFARKLQSISTSGATPVLNWNPAVPADVQSAVQGQFSSQYQGALKAQGASESGDVSGIGDVELIAGWHYVGDKLRVLGSAALVVPTGKYSADAGPDIGNGNFYTVRPAIQVAYLPTSNLAFAAKVSAGLNSRNRDNDVRSGNWFGVELAAGYKTPIGVVGVHGIRIQQYQDDENNPLGASRLRSNNLGAFFTTMIPAVDVALTVQYMATTSSRNAKHGNFTQVRLIRMF